MSLATLPRPRDGLLGHGIASDLPAPVIENGGTDGQHVVHGTLATIAADAPCWSTGGPARLLLGEAVGLGVGAGDGNRTRIASLEGWSSTIELHPRRRRFTGRISGTQSPRA